MKTSRPALAVDILKVFMLSACYASRDALRSTTNDCD
jgi:hypothetical protein